MSQTRIIVPVSSKSVVKYAQGTQGDSRSLFLQAYKFDYYRVQSY